MTDKTLTFEERQELERQQRRANAQQIKAAADEVLRELGEGWSVTAREDSWTIAPDSHFYEFRHTDGRQFSFDGDAYACKGKVHVSGRYDFGPSHLGLGFPYGKSRPGISMSISRGGVAMAKDIKRRFLPEYTALFQEIADRVKVHLQAYNEKASAAEFLGALAGAKVSAHGFRTLGGGIEGKVWNVSGLRVELKFDGLTETNAAQLIQLYKSFQKTEGS